MVYFRDIGARKTAEAERERLLADTDAARREAEAANRAKSEFLAVMSHELRTPLNAIGGYAELLDMGLRGPITDLQRADLARIRRSQQHLLGLINEVLNYAKLETGAVAFHPADVSLAAALVEAEALVAPQAQAKGLTLTIHDCAPELAARADAEKLRQVLVNLLSNAVKFTDGRDGRPGRIDLSCAAEGTAAGARVVVRVRDTGMGIPPDKLGVIFDPFVQVRSDLTRTAEGTGLGLAISRDLARGMGGELTAESVPGVGSTFTLTLPAAGAPAGSSDDRTPRDWRPVGCRARGRRRAGEPLTDCRRPDRAAARRRRGRCTSWPAPVRRAAGRRRRRPSG
jgi:signal transduction histidine kinase